MRAGVRGAAAFGCVGRVQPRCDEADAGAFAYSSYRSVVDGTNMLSCTAPSGVLML